MEVYSAPDFIHYGPKGTSLVKLNLYGPFQKQSRTTSGIDSIVWKSGFNHCIVFIEGEKWIVNRITPMNDQVQKSLNL